ncbi:hypothetical protein SB782_33970, partial [Brevibacillus sp. SIMBA_076]
DGTLPDGYALDEGVGLVYRGRRPAEVVAERPRAYAWRVERDGGGVRETLIEPRVLGQEYAAA